MNTANNLGTLYIISAPSGGGKTTLVRSLLDIEKSITISVSHTTRNKRPNEQDGINYYFVQEDEFQEMVSKDAFLEYATVFGEHYGTSLSVVTQKLEQGLDVILDIDWQGARLVRERIKQAVSIFILPPSVKELEKRLHTRKQDSEIVIQSRMQEAFSEITHYAEYDYIIINEDFDTALEDLQSIVRSTHLLKSKQVVKHQKLINALLEK